jgi:hypothetical protein
MKEKIMRSLRLTILLTVPLALSAAASDFTWNGRIAPGQSIEIKGVNGFVRAERANGIEARVTADKTGHRSDPNGVQIQVVPHADGVTICAVYPSGESRPNECKPGSGGRMNTHNNDVKVEFTVLVPPGVRFIGRTVNGNVEADSLGADTEVHTVNGKVRVSTTGAAEAHTVNGSITASMGAKGWSRPLEFHTVNGSITVELPAAASAQVEASTVNGRISTDFPLTIRGGFSGRHITGTIGGGGPELSLETVNGSIELRKSGS